MIVCFSVDYRQVPSSVIAALAKGIPCFEQALQGSSLSDGYVILSTCARFEIYVEANSQFLVRDLLLDALSSQCYPTEAISTGGPAMFVGRHAVEHLFRVASGLESQVAGEAEILGQVRAALVDAKDSKSITRSLELAFSTAIHVSRKVRSTFIPANQSLIDAALGDLQIKRTDVAVLLGTGRYAKVCAKALSTSGFRTILGFSASGNLDFEIGVNDFLDETELPAAMSIADVVVSCSGHGQPLITSTLVRKSLDLRDSRHEMTIIDLAASSDVSPEVDKLSGVRVLRLANIISRDVDLEPAHLLIQERLDVAMLRIESSKLDDAVVALRSSVADFVRHHFPDQDSLNTHRFVQTLLHEPTRRIREAARQGRSDFIHRELTLLLSKNSDDFLDALQNAFHYDDLSISRHCIEVS